jgi:effector-binding domain-containing protein
MRYMTACLLILTVVLVASCAGSPEPPPEVAKAQLPIRVVHFPEQTLLIRAHTGPFAEISTSIDEFLNYLGTTGIEPTGDLGGAFFDDPATTPPEETRYEIRIPVVAGTAAEEPYEVRTTEAMKTAAVLLVGSYERISKMYPAVYAWVEANGYVPAGPLMEIYLVHPGSGVTPGEYQTEVHIPVVEASMVEDHTEADPMEEEVMEEDATMEEGDMDSGEME